MHLSSQLLAYLRSTHIGAWALEHPVHTAHCQAVRTGVWAQDVNRWRKSAHSTCDAGAQCSQDRDAEEPENKTEKPKLEIK